MLKCVRRVSEVRGGELAPAARGGWRLESEVVGGDPDPRPCRSFYRFQTVLGTFNFTSNQILRASCLTYLVRLSNISPVNV